jgi:hypothetical protein
MDSNWYGALLEEYKSLRTEALTARDAQLSILRVAVPLLAALIGLGVTVGLEDETVVGGLVLAIAVPLVVALTFEMWFAEVKRSVRAGAVVAATERRLGGLFPSETRSPAGWELWLRSETVPRYGKKQERSQQQNESVFSAAVIFSFLALVAVIGSGVGLYFLWDYDLFVLWAALCGCLVGFLPLRVGLAVRDIKRRNEVPSEDEVWPVRETGD